jgi:hypothetical protein
MSGENIMTEPKRLNQNDESVAAARREFIEAILLKVQPNFGSDLYNMHDLREQLQACR